MRKWGYWEQPAPEDSLRNLFKDGREQVKEKADDLKDEYKEKYSDFKDDIKDKYSEAKDDLKDKVKDRYSDLKDDIKDKLPKYSSIKGEFEGKIKLNGFKGKFEGKFKRSKDKTGVDMQRPPSFRKDGDKE